MMHINTMRKLVTILFFLLILCVTPVYAGSSFHYSRVIQTDNLIGYKSVVLDKDVYAHSSLLNDLRVINEQDEEVPYIIASIGDALTESEKSSFILSEGAQYISTQDGTDSVITIQVNHRNAFSLEINTDDLRAFSYGLFGLKEELTTYLSDGEIVKSTPLASAHNKDIAWTSNPPIDKLRLIIHSDDGVPINLNSVTIKYHLDKLVFKDPGNSQLSLAYGNDALRLPIYENLKNYQEILQSNIITPTGLGAEVKSPVIVSNPATPTHYKFLFKSILTTLVLLMFLIVGHRIRKTK